MQAYLDYIRFKVYLHVPCIQQHSFNFESSFTLHHTNGISGCLSHDHFLTRPGFKIAVQSVWPLLHGFDVTSQLLPR
jgi:hypothetical protein